MSFLKWQMTKYSKPLQDLCSFTHACFSASCYYSPRLHLCDTNDHLVTHVTVPYTPRPPPSSQNPTPDKTSQSRVHTCRESDTERGYVNEGSVSTCSQIKPEHRDSRGGDSNTTDALCVRAAVCALLCLWEWKKAVRSGSHQQICLVISSIG